jgi:hypothetical protein
MDRHCIFQNMGVTVTNYYEIDFLFPIVHYVSIYWSTCRATDQWKYLQIVFNLRAALIKVSFHMRFNLSNSYI